MVYLILAIFVSLYLVWYLYGKVLLQLKNYIVKTTTVRVFDLLLASFLIALVIARIGYIFANLSFYKQFGFSFLPYIKFKGHVSLLEFFPWRVLRFHEGVDRILLYIVWLILGIFLIPFRLLLKYKQAIAKGNNVKLNVFFIYLLAIMLFILITIIVWGHKIAVFNG